MYDRLLELVGLRAVVGLGTTFAIFLPMMVRDQLRGLAVLQSPQRTLILDLIKARPGTPVGELLDRVPFGGGTLYHHLAKLRLAGAIYIVTSGRRRLVYPATHVASPETVAATNMLRGRTARNVALVIVQSEQVSVAQISARLNESPRVVYYHVQRFVETGIAELVPAVGQREVRARPVLRATLEALGVREIEPVRDGSGDPESRA